MNSPSAVHIYFTLNVSPTANGICSSISFLDAEVIPIEWEEGINGQNDFSKVTCSSRNSLNFPISHVY